MKTNRVAQAAAVILAIFGVALLAAGLIATSKYTVVVRRTTFPVRERPGPQGPRNKVSNRGRCRPNYQQAYRRCSDLSSARTQTATKFLIIGVIPLLIVLMLPSLTRRSRRSRRRMGL